MRRISNTSAFAEIKLGEENQVPSTVQILRVGKFNHPQYGTFEITPFTLIEMKNNFDKNIRGVDLAFDYYHASDKDAAAWVKGLQLREENTELWAEVDWTPKARQKLAERELRYFSPDFAFVWKDPETGNTFSNVLFGGGLTNRPFVKEMAAIVADEKYKGETMTELEKVQQENATLKATNLKLSEENADMKKQVEAAPQPSELEMMKKQLAELQEKIKAAEAKEQTALAEKKKLEEQIQCSEKEKEFNVLLSEGKACAAQKDAFVKGDMMAFIKLAQPVNTKGAGNSSNQNDETPEQKTLKLAEQKRKDNPKLDMAESISLARKELATK